MTPTAPYKPTAADQARIDQLHAEMRQEIAAEAKLVPPPGPCPSWCELPAGHPWTELDGGLLVTGETVPLVLRRFHRAIRGSWEIGQRQLGSRTAGVTSEEAPYCLDPDHEEESGLSLSQLWEYRDGLDDAIALLERAVEEYDGNIAAAQVMAEQDAVAHDDGGHA